MPVPTVPKPGQPALPFIVNSAMWEQLMMMLAEWQGNKGNPAGSGSEICRPVVENNTGFDVEVGQVIQLGSVDGNEIDGDVEAATDVMYTPLFDLEIPLWQLNMDNLFIAASPIPDGESGQVEMSRYMAIPAIQPVGGPGAKSGWLMPSETPTDWLKFCKTSGMYRVIGWYDLLAPLNVPDIVAIVDTTQSQNWWMYELTEDSQAPATTKAKLLDLEETEFAAEIDLSDPQGLMDDQTTGDKGYCIHLGNEFLAMQAVCKE